MELIHNKSSLALIPFLVVLITMLKHSCMGYSYTYSWTSPYNGIPSTPPKTRYGPPSTPPNTGYGSPSPPPKTGYGSPPPPPDAGTGDANSQQAYLDAHNEARALVGVGKMKWSDTVAAYAQRYANIRKADCALQHSVDDKYGECIAEGTDPQFSGRDAVKLWVAEKAYYDYHSNTCASGQVCGHYTQVVWNNTVNLGCARVVCDNNRGAFVTCNYDPPGNYVGESPINLVYFQSEIE